MMNAYEIRDGSGIAGLTVTERPATTLQPGQVRMRVRAVSLNYRDLGTVKNAGSRKRLPLVPCSDGAGEVMEIGAGVTRVRKGDRVAAIFLQTWLSGEQRAEHEPSALGGGLDGMLAEEVVLHEDGVVHVPEHLSYEEASTLPCAAITAWHALIEKGRLKPGDTVLVQGTGGVSIFALQIALMTGARVIVTSKSDEKLDRARKMGASGLINYVTTPEWDKAVLDQTDGVGVDHVVEVGGPGTLERSFRAVRIGGTISLIGVLTGQHAINPMPVLGRKIRLQGIYVGSREMFQAMNAALALHRVRPVIDRVFSFQEAQQAFRYMESAAHFGKIVIRV